MCGTTQHRALHPPLSPRALALDECAVPTDGDLRALVTRSRGRGLMLHRVRQIEPEVEGEG